jgi:DNA-binding NarL/FixJ family response regulator
MSPDSDPIRVFVVDDHETVRVGLRTLFELEEDIVVVGDAMNGELALQGIEGTRPQVAMLDLRLPDVDGVELCREVRARFPETRCLIFTAFSDEEALLDAIVAGASGYLLKGDVGEETIEAVRAVASGGTLIDPATTEAVMAAARRPAGGPEVKLSTQQERVLELIVEGLTNRDIADRMDLAEKTVKNYVSTILGKLQVRSRTQAAVFGWKRKDEAEDERRT